MLKQKRANTFCRVSQGEELLPRTELNLHSFSFWLNKEHQMWETFWIVSEFNYLPSLLLAMEARPLKGCPSRSLWRTDGSLLDHYSEIYTWTSMLLFTAYNDSLHFMWNSFFYCSFVLFWGHTQLCSGFLLGQFSGITPERLRELYVRSNLGQTKYLLYYLFNNYYFYIESLKQKSICWYFSKHLSMLNFSTTVSCVHSMWTI